MKSDIKISPLPVLGFISGRHICPKLYKLLNFSGKRFFAYVAHLAKTARFFGSQDCCTWIRQKKYTTPTLFEIFDL